jgi:N utilization substance protein B
MTASSKRTARELVVRGLYYYQINPSAISDITEYLLKQVKGRVDYKLFNTLFAICIDQFDSLLALSLPYTRPSNDISIIEKAILVLMAAELRNNPKTPNNVIINEAIEISKRYGAHESYKFINGVGDKLVKALRS